MQRSCKCTRRLFGTYHWPSSISMPGACLIGCCGGVAGKGTSAQPRCRRSETVTPAEYPRCAVDSSLRPRQVWKLFLLGADELRPSPT